MAARHYLQDELKQKAGVGRGGAKDGKPVGHLLISWKKEEAEAEQLSHLGMINAANGALRAIGASQHQALIIGHTDTRQRNLALEAFRERERQNKWISFEAGSRIEIRAKKL